ncbi:MAG TPA: HAD-IA family hydrolase [Armatimonadota bacterium]|nr:HAD-IA family hydrolase [Armatimonadota bacterium]
MSQMTNPFHGIRAVLFDLDGTLVETNIDFGLMRREMLALGERYGVPASEMQGLDILSIVDFIALRLMESSRPDDADRVRGEAFEKLEQIELAHCREAQPVGGAVALLNALREAQIKIGIITRSCGSAVRVSTARSGMSWDVLLTRDDVPNAKPHPDHLHRALDMLGVRPEEAIMVGDHWMDVQGGKAAGTRTVGFLRPGRPDDFFDEVKPDLVVRGLAELIGYVKRLKK